MGVKLMDKLSWALAHVGRVFHGGAFRRVLGRRRNRARETGRVLVERGNGTGGLLGVSRRYYVDGGKQEVARHVGGLGMAGTQQCVPLLEEDDMEGEVGLGQGALSWARCQVSPLLLFSLF